MKRILTVVLLAVGTLAQAQVDAPKPHLDKVEFGLIMAHAGVRALDVYSTHRALQNGYHEMVLPKFIANHDANLIIYSGLAVVADAYVAHRLEMHNHRKLARLVTSIDLAQDAGWALNNLTLTRHSQTETGTLRGPGITLK